WGWNYFGQLGDGTTDSHSTPVPVSGLTNVTAIAAGSGHSIALKSDGTVRTWGNNVYGQLGIGSSDENPHPTPVAVSGVVNIVAITAGDSHNLVLTGWRLAWQNTQNGDVSFWQFNGTGVTKTGPIASAIPLAWNLVGALDVNADGSNDLLWHNTQTGDLVYW